MVHRISQRWKSFIFLVLATATLWLSIAPILKAEVTAPQLIRQGTLAYEQGEFEWALQLWQQATIAYQQGNDRLGTTGSLLNQTQALQQLGLYRRACKVAAQAVQVKEQVCEPGDRTTVKSTLVLPDLPEATDLKAKGWLRLSEMLRLVGNLEQAQTVLKQHADSSEVWLSLGNIARDLGNRDRDRKDAIKLPDSFSPPICAAGSTDAMGYYWQAIGCYQNAIQQAPESTAAMQARLNSLSLQIGMAQWFRKAKQIQTADRWIAQVRSAINSLIPPLTSSVTNLPPTYEGITTRINFAHSLIDFSLIAGFAPQFEQSRSLLETAMQQAKALNNRQAEAYAIGNMGWLYEQTQQWDYAERLTRQAVQLAQSIRATNIQYEWQWQHGRILARQGKRDAALQSYEGAIAALKLTRQSLTAVNPDAQFSLRDTVEPLYREYASLLLSDEPDQPSLRKAIDLIDALQLAELENFFRCNLLEAQSVKVEEANDPTAAIFYTIILPDRLEVILKLPQQQNLKRYFTPITSHTLAQQVEDLRKGLEKRVLSGETEDLSRSVYDTLIRQTEAELKAHNIKTLVFVLDGNLRRIPISALYDGQAYLIEKYAVAMTPGLRILGPKKPLQQSLGALVAGLSTANAITVQGETIPFDALTNVKIEVQQIQASVGQSEVLLDQEFTTERFRDRVQELPYPIVHIATHGHFSSDPEKTFILTTSPTPVNVNELQTVLQRRGQRQPNPIELLVLSACETARGDRRATLGLAGVAIRAGAFGTLASLWAVNDESTAKLMQVFYQTLQQNPGIHKAEALQQAQKSLLESSKNAPYFWAPFVLVGNWL